MKNGIELITEERQRQIEEEGFTAEYDSQHCLNQLAIAAAFYALPWQLRIALCEAAEKEVWPLPGEWYKPTEDTKEGTIIELKRAGAMIAAEIDRLQNT